MVRQRTSLLGVSALAFAALVLAAGPALAQRGGGGHGGGGHGGGGFGGGGRAGGVHAGGFGGGGSSFSHGGRGGVVIRPIRPGFYGGFYGGYPRLYGGYYGGLYWGGSYDNSYYFGSAGDSYASSMVPASDVAVASDAAALGNYQANYPAEPAPTDPNTASLTIRVPADAEIWFDNTKMTLTGMVREFVTPPLTPDKDYSYLIRARWTANDKVFDQTHRIGFRAGKAILVDFLTPPPSAGSQGPVMPKAP